MGMTDRQFDSYQAKILRLLKRAEDEIIQTDGASRKQLRELIEEMEAELKRP